MTTTVRSIAVGTAAVVLLASIAPPAAAGTTTTTDARAYDGTHVSFRADGSALANYSVGNDTVASAIRVQSASEVEADLGIGVGGDLSAVTDIEGASLAVEAGARANATIRADSGATIRVHDHERGTLVVEAGESEQYVTLGANATSEVRAESDSRAVVTTDGGTEAAVLVAGDGAVTVNDEGNLTARLEANSRLVVRATENRTESDRAEERAIVDGTVAAEVYVDGRSNGTVAGTITYDANTSVEVEHRSDGELRFEVDRSRHEGKILVASASNASFAAETTDSGSDSDSVSVRVDGEAAVRASSHSELRAATESNGTSKYLVDGSTRAETRALVAVDQFSERRVTVSRSDDRDAVARADANDDGRIDIDELQTALVGWTSGTYTDLELQQVVVAWAGSHR